MIVVVVTVVVIFVVTRKKRNVLRQKVSPFSCQMSAHRLRAGHGRLSANLRPLGHLRLPRFPFSLRFKNQGDNVTQ